MTVPPTDTAWCAVRFLTQYRLDQQRGDVRPLEEYLRRFPGDDALIAREYLVASEPSAPLDRGSFESEDFGRYRLLRELGRGGQGVVYAARDHRLERDVALKILRTQEASEVEVLRLTREAMAASRLEHPGICRVYDVGSVDGRPYFAMQLLEGGTLAERVADWQRLDLQPCIEDVLRIVETVAVALHAAHEAGIVHRDVKPANIAFGDDDRPVLLDFGLARESAGDLPTLTKGAACGTPAYMAPEQLRADFGPIDRRSDVWSLGVLLYELLTLERPFVAPTHEGICAAIAAGPMPDLRRARPGASKVLAVVVNTALQRDVNSRYGTALALAEDLRRVREQQPIAARPPSMIQTVSRWSQRNRGLATAILTVFLLLSAGLVSTSVFVHRESVLRAAAETQAKQVHSAARELLFELDDQLRDLPGATEARKRVLGCARDWLKQLHDEDGVDSALVEDLAASFIKLGDVLGHPGTSNVGDAEGSILCYRRALELSGASSSPASTYNRISALSRIGDLCLSTDCLDEADEALSRSAAIVDALTPELRTVAIDTIRASVEVHLGQVAETRGDYRGALTHAESAVARMSAIVERSDASLDAKLHLAGMRSVQGILLERTGELAAAFAIVRATATELEELAVQHPYNELLWSRAGAAWVQVGRMAGLLGEEEDMVASLDRGVGWCRKRHEQDSSDASAARHYALSLMTRVEHRNTDDWSSAERDLATAIAALDGVLEAHPSHFLARLAWTRVQACLGSVECGRGALVPGRARAEKAAEVAEELVAAEPQNQQCADLAVWCQELLERYPVTDR